MVPCKSYTSFFAVVHTRDQQQNETGCKAAVDLWDSVQKSCIKWGWVPGICWKATFSQAVEQLLLPYYGTHQPSMGFQTEDEQL